MPNLQQGEQDFPPGHPGRGDYNPNSPEAGEWARSHVAPLGQRDFPVGHPAAVDTPGHKNFVVWQPGVDPFNPQREPFTGRSEEQAAAVKELSRRASLAAVESPIAIPLDAVVLAHVMNARRHELGRDLLTPAEYAEVMAREQEKARERAAAAAAQKE